MKSLNFFTRVLKGLLFCVPRFWLIHHFWDHLWKFSFIIPVFCFGYFFSLWTFLPFRGLSLFNHSNLWCSIFIFQNLVYVFEIYNVRLWCWLYSRFILVSRWIFKYTRKNMRNTGNRQNEERYFSPPSNCENNKKKKIMKILEKSVITKKSEERR